jgi:hypothetical protein
MGVTKKKLKRAEYKAMRDPLVRPMLKHTKPGPMKDKRRLLIEKARKEELDDR